MGLRLQRAGRATLLAVVLAACLSLAPGRTRQETETLIPRIEQMVPADRAPTTDCTFVLRTALPTAPEALRVYRVRERVPKKPIFLALVRALPIAATPEVQETIRKFERAPEPAGEEVAGSVGGWTVEVVRGGAWSCSGRREGGSARDVIAGRKLEPPSAESVRKVADSFLARTRLMPKGMRFSGVQATEWIGAGVGNATAVSWSACYTRDIEGTPVQSGVRVDVGPDLRLLGARSSARELVPDRLVPIISPQEAFDLLRAGKGYFNGTTVEKGRRYVDSARLTYWQGPFAGDWEYVVPIYLFDTGTGADRCSAFVEAVRPEYLQKPPASPSDPGA